MSHPSNIRHRASRASSTASCAAVLALAALAPAASASPQPGYPLGPTTATLDYACQMPGISRTGIKLEVDVAELNQSEGRGSEIRLGAWARLTLAQGLKESLRLRGVVGLSGTGDLGISFFDEGWGETVLDGAVPLTLAPTTLGDGPLQIRASGRGTSFEPPYTSDYDVPEFDVASLSLELAARDASGIVLPYQPIDPNVPETDEDKPYTYKVLCQLDPSTQNPRLVAGSTLDKQPPTAPGKPAVKNLYGSDAELSWAASTDDTEVASYWVSSVWTGYGTIRGTSARAMNLIPGTTYTLTVQARDRAGNASPPSEPTIFTTPRTDLTKPSTPGSTTGYSSDDGVGDGFIDVRWVAATDAGDVTGYRIEVAEDGVALTDTYRVGADARSLQLRGTGKNSHFRIKVFAVNAAGRESDALNLYRYTGVGPVNVAPTAVTGLRTADTPTYDAVDLTWNASTDSGEPLQGYDVYRDGAFVKRVSGPSARIEGLQERTSYEFAVKAIDAQGRAGERSALLTVTTPERDEGSAEIVLSYALSGSSQIKTLTKGALPLTGTADTIYNLALGSLSADLALKPTQGRLTALGFIPVTAKVAFVTSGRTTGQRDGGVLTTKSLVRIKLPEVKLFGAVPLAGGNNCQTKSLSTIVLKSTDYDPFKGGSLAGTYAISDLNGCGVLNGLVSPLTAGGGNAISLSLTPQSTK